MSVDKIAPGKPYTCAQCEGEFIGTREHADCIAEQETIFGEADSKPEDRVLICHDCWVELMRRMGMHTQ